MTFRTTIVNYLEKIVRVAYGWIDDSNEVLGEIVYTLHLFGFYTLLVLIVVSHLVYPVFWFQLCVFITLFLIWIQHILLKTCIFTSLERRLLGNKHPLMIDTILTIFDLSIDKNTRMGVTLLLSTMGVIFLGLELVARSVMYGRSILGVSTWV